jgi:hypothetical protein
MSALREASAAVAGPAPQPRHEVRPTPPDTELTAATQLAAATELQAVAELSDVVTGS